MDSEILEEDPRATNQTDGRDAGVRQSEIRRSTQPETRGTSPEFFVGSFTPIRGKGQGLDEEQPGGQ
ncbi:unnamed protein product [Cuscuta campestris]|uniref:Uncharacterized protein n=1 Tax=Cuscuta campestris TaxID=132261 RepID=A0A484KP98_9ASTE|nr:unnamed protein product [Cuscuta campestris]